MTRFQSICIIFLLFLFVVTSPVSAQIQVGSDIVGTEDNDATGRTVEMSADGTIVAISGHFYGSNNGQLRVFSLQSQEWTQIGQTFVGAPFQQLGGKITLSGDGQRLAMNSGSIKVYKYENDSWVQIGQSLVQEITNEGFGSQIALSYGGDYLAVGTHLSDAGGTNAGGMRVFQLIGNSWIKVGEDIPGPSAESRMGDAISISDDGQTVIAGMDGDDEVASNSGKVQVFRYAANEWTQLGQDINGLGTWDFLGAGVDISGDGTVIGVTCADGVGETCMYELSGGSWVQMGNCLERFRTSIALSYDGYFAAVGEDGDGTVARASGRGALFQYDGNEWNQVGQDILGDQQDDNCGRSIDLSADGRFLAIGATRSRIGDTRPGFIRVYDITTVLPVTLASFEASPSGKSAKLDWTTSSEYNNEKFIVEHSEDALNWTQIGEVLSHSISTTDQSRYSFSHRTPALGLNYYRLVQIDFNGDLEYSDVKTINFSVSAGISFYPNPANNILNLESATSLPIRALGVYRLDGQLVKSLPSVTNTLFVGDLPKGIYVLRFIHGSNQENRKFIVN